MKNASNAAVAATTVDKATPSRPSAAERERRRYSRRERAEAERERVEAERERVEIRRELRTADLL